MKNRSLKSMVRKLQGRSPVAKVANPLRADPSRTLSLRRQQEARMRQRFDGLKAEILKRIGDEDWLGLVERGSGSNRGVKSPKELTTNQTASFYLPFIFNSSVGYFPSEGLIEVPDIRQKDSHSCGAAVVMSIAEYFSVGSSMTLENWKTELGTDRTDGTTPSAIVDTLVALGLLVETFEYGNLENLWDYTARGMPVIVPIQTNRGNVKADTAGHYVIVLSIANGYVFVQDPSIDNVLEDANHAIQAAGRSMIAEEDFLTIWHDKDGEGNPYVRYGIAVGPIRSGVIQNENPNHDAQGRFAPSPGNSNTHTETLGIIDKVKATIGASLGAFIDKVPGGKALRSKLSNLNEGMKARYGEKTTLRIVAVANGISWGAFTVGPLVGHPNYIPASGLMLTGAVLAESYLQLSRAAKVVGHFLPGKQVLRNTEQLTEEYIQTEAKRLVESLHAEYQLSQPTENTRWQFHTNHEKVQAFQQWIQTQIRTRITNPNEQLLWKKYIQQGYRKGAARAFDDTNRQRRAASVGIKKYKDKQGRMRTAPADTSDFYKGNREQFLRSSFAHPESVEKVKLLASRTYTDLVGVTETMAHQLRRTLTDGLVQGKGAKEIARDLAENVDGIGRTRALLIARTELIRAHAEGQLDGLENLGVTTVGAAVEWSTSGLNTVDKKGRPLSPCDKCKPLNGIVLKISEARGLIPRHPNCLCAWIPAGLGEDDTNQLATVEEIEDAFDQSQLENPPELSANRPKGIV